MNGKLVLSGLAAAAGLVLFVAVLLAGEQMGAGMVGLCAGIGGALLGAAGGA